MLKIKCFKVGSFHTRIKFGYRHSVKCLDYLFLYINNLVFLHCGLYSTTHNCSYRVVVRELTAFHRILFLWFRSWIFSYFKLFAYSSITIGTFTTGSKFINQKYFIIIFLNKVRIPLPNVGSLNFICFLYSQSPIQITTSSGFPNAF